MPHKGRGAAVKRPCKDDYCVTSKQIKAEVRDDASPLCYQSPAKLFESFIHPLGTDDFFKTYWEKKPLHIQRSDSGIAAYHQTLFQLSDLKTLCGHSLEYARDLNVCRCVNGKKKVLNKKGLVKFNSLLKDFNHNKATIQFHQPQRFKDELWKLMEKLECFFGTLVGCNVYITPQGSQGLPPHHDDVEVFILQLEGKKRWRLYNPTVPLARDYSLQSEENIGEPTHDIILQEGDLLYFPRGTIHQAETPEEVLHSTHLTLSTYQRMSWGDLLLDVFPRMLSDQSRTDLNLRQGIPRAILLGSGVDVRMQLAASLRSLADEMESGKQELQFCQLTRDFVMNRLPPYAQTDNLPLGDIPALRDIVRLKFKDHLLITVEWSPERPDESTELVVFVLHSLKNHRESHMMGESGDEGEHSVGLRFPLSHLKALQQLQQEEQMTVSELDLSSDDDKVSLVVALWSESLLEVCRSTNL